ncbi:hypothetical protein [Thermomonas sp.]|uniref:hypothetical protein n=1 Tax=Thermomonas sp. TaxID=1971895 RepID=UPI0035B0F719
MSWDPFQRAVLAELGYALYRPAATLPALDADMLARLARAAAATPDVLQQHADLVAASLRLRGDAAGKRALWPRLRALRRGLA